MGKPAADNQVASPDSGDYLQGWPLFFLLTGICLAMFLISLDRTIITTVGHSAEIAGMSNLTDWSGHSLHDKRILVDKRHWLVRFLIPTHCVRLPASLRSRFSPILCELVVPARNLCSRDRFAHLRRRFRLSDFDHRTSHRWVRKCRNIDRELRAHGPGHPSKDATCLHSFHWNDVSNKESHLEKQFGILCCVFLCLLGVPDGG